MDYGFKLVYSDTTCNDSIEGVIIEDYFSNYQEIGYIAPKISTGEMTLHQFIGQNIEYPRLAREQGIMGVVYVSFMILSTGEIDNIKIKRGKNIFLDKEAVRVIRKLKFSSPPTYKGIPYKICLTIPITFKMT
jgi:protein TonB